MSYLSKTIKSPSIRLGYYLLAMVAISLLLGACGSTSTVKQPLRASGYQYQIVGISSSAPDVPEKFTKNLRKYLQKALSKNNSLGSNKSAKNVTIKINSFKMAGLGSRMLLGSFAGKDLVNTLVTVTDPNSGKTLGSATIESKDSLAGGGPELFTSNHAKAIAKFLLGKS